MIKDITYVFPQSSPEMRTFFVLLCKVLESIPAAKTTGKIVQFAPGYPAAGLPTTSFAMAAGINFPEIRFRNGRNLVLTAGNLRINPQPDTPISKPQGSLLATKHADELGTFYEIHLPGMSVFRLPLEELHKRLAGHILSIDHTGVNLPAELVDRSAWTAFLKQLGAQTNLYRYPEGDDWPFIVPATAHEFATDIADFKEGREPRFELVYEHTLPVPMLQFDVRTDLARSELERLFPEPYSLALEGLGEYFRSVYIHHPWPGLIIKFDMRYKNRNPGDVWETGEWLVKSGGRISGDKAVGMA